MTTRFNQRVFQLRKRIAEQSAKLNITTAHDNEAHFYERDGKRYPSVSAKLKFIKDPSLAQYASNMSIEYVKEHWQEFNHVNIDMHLAKAKRASQDIMIDAGSVGTAAHAITEGWFRDWIDKGELIGQFPMPEVGTVDSRVISCVHAMKAIIERYGLIPLATEIPLVDHDLKLGGQLDDIMMMPRGRMSGDIVLVDKKTSNRGDKTAYYYQVAFYYEMFVNLYSILPRRVYVAHLSKDDGGGKLIEIPNIRQLVKEAKGVLKLAESYERIEESKKKVPIIYTPKTDA